MVWAVIAAAMFTAQDAFRMEQPSLVAPTRAAEATTNVAIQNTGVQNAGPNDADAGPINLTRHGFKRSTLTTPAGEMAVFEAGEGEPLLLLHGVGAGASSYIWFRVAPLLAEHYRVIAPDFVGWGESDRPERQILIDDYVAQIRVLGDWIGGPTRVAAQSLTSGFLIAAMRDGGIKITRLSLHAPTGGLDFGVDAFGPGATQNFARIAASPRAKEVYESIFHQRPAIEDWFRGPGFFDPAAVPAETIESSLYFARQPNASFSALPFLSGAIRYDIAPYLKEINVPTLMIWGEGEIQISPPVRERIEKVNPDIKVATIGKARTSFEIERPEETLAVLLPFLKAGD